eukprot:Clim_evm63s109 gene=Clim_evmTU63s109
MKTLDLSDYAADKEAAKSVKKLIAKDKKYDAIGKQIKAFESCHHLDLSKNAIKDIDALSKAKLPLTWLSLKENQVQDISPLAGYSKLVTLNVQQNKLKDVDFSSLKLDALSAFVANENEIATVRGLDAVTNLNALILSRNNLTSITGLSKLKKLSKLSLTNNQLSEIPDLKANVDLTEVRLRGNKIKNIGDKLITLGKLRILDLGVNGIKGLAELDSLKGLDELRYLILEKNPVAEHPDFESRVQELLPKLVSLDNKRLMPKRGLKVARQRAAAERAANGEAKDGKNRKDKHDKHDKRQKSSKPDRVKQSKSGATKLDHKKTTVVTAPDTAPATMRKEQPLKRSADEMLGHGESTVVPAPEPTVQQVKLNSKKPTIGSDSGVLSVQEASTEEKAKKKHKRDKKAKKSQKATGDAIFAQLANSEPLGGGGGWD